LEDIPNMFPPDGKVVKSYDCQTCGSIYTVSYNDDEVDTGYSTSPEYCPFCSERDNSIDDDLGIDMTDNVSFGKGVDMMDGDDDDY
jgi:hypothetical protein